MIGKSRTWLALFAGLLAAACAPLGTVPVHHLVMFDKHGRAMDPTGICSRPKPADQAANVEYKPCNTDFVTTQQPRELRQEFNPYMKALFDELKTNPKANSTIGANQHKNRKVLIFIHGGLNTNKDTLDRVKDRTDAILDAGYYPIFIGWQSSLISSWTDNLLHVRNGHWYGAVGLALAPFYLIGDAVRSIGRAPVVWTSQLANAKDNLTAVFAQRKVRENIEYCALRRDYEEHRQHAIAISKGKSSRTFPEEAYSATKLSAMAAIKFVLSPLLDGVGSAAWSMIDRRAHLLFYDDPEEFFKDATTAPQEGNGGLAIFMRTLQGEIKDSQCRLESRPGDDCVNWQITLVVHSAGAIVANDILTLFPKIAFSRIVYMAAACSVSDYERSVWPYLKMHPEARFYHVVLHDVAELKESHYAEIPPRGSLLVWIDDLFSRPVAPRDRTAGRFRNLLGAIKNTPEDIRHQISVKAFGIGKHRCPKPCPQQHDQFSNQDFWLEELWTPEVPGSTNVDDQLCHEVASAPH